MSDDQIVSIFARWRNLEDEKARIAEDSKELFAEAKGNGFDAKALRLAFRQKIKSDEPESEADRATRALVETYLTALEERPRARPAPARVEKIEEIPAAPVETSATDTKRGEPRETEDRHDRAGSLEAPARSLVQGRTATTAAPDTGPPYDDLAIPANLVRH